MLIISFGPPTIFLFRVDCVYVDNVGSATWAFVHAFSDGLLGLVH